VADVRTIADCSLQRSVCNCNKDIIIIIIIIIITFDYFDLATSFVACGVLSSSEGQGHGSKKAAARRFVLP